MSTVNNFTLTQNETTGNWELTCLNDDFNAQEKKVKLNCKDRNMTGDLIVDVKAKTGSATIHSFQRKVYPSIDYTNKQAYTPATTITLTGDVTAGWVTSITDGDLTLPKATTTISTTTKYVSPTKNQITVSRDSNNFLDKVIVYAVPDTSIRRGIDSYTKVTSPIDTSTSGIGDNLNIGTVYSYQMIQSLKSESTGQYCRFYAKGINGEIGSNTHTTTYGGSAGYWIGSVDDGDILMCQYAYAREGSHYWNWILMRTNGTQDLFGVVINQNPNYCTLSDVRLDKQNDASEKVMKIVLTGTYTPE